MGYNFYLGDVHLPVTPSKLRLNIGNKNKTVQLIDDGEINILSDAALTTIDFDAVLPNVEYPFASYGGKRFAPASTFLAQLERLKVDKLPFRFIVTRSFPNGKIISATNMSVSLENYTINESAENGFDVTVSIKLKQYREYGTKTCKFPEDNNGTKLSAEVSDNRETQNSPAPKQDTTIETTKDENIWLLAKRVYGDGGKSATIQDVNRLHLAVGMTIAAGTKLILPLFSSKTAGGGKGGKFSSGGMGGKFSSGGKGGKFLSKIASGGITGKF